MNTCIRIVGILRTNLVPLCVACVQPGGQAGIMSYSDTGTPYSIDRLYYYQVDYDRKYTRYTCRAIRVKEFR